MIFLHIGRPKTGTTTIQTFLAEQASSLEEANYHVVDRVKFIAAVNAIRTQSSVRGLKEFERLFESNTSVNFLVSHEHLYDIKYREQIEAIKVATSSHDVMIMGYLRDHPSLLMSLYNQYTKKGRNAVDFDSYAQEVAPTLSAGPTLGMWADVFGVDRLRVRSLDPRSLSGGNLLDDYLEAVNLTGILRNPAAASGRMNTSEPWMWVELTRAISQQVLLQFPSDRGENIPLAAQRLYKRLLSAQEANRVEPRAQYVTMAQWSLLRDRYNEELTEVSSLMKNYEIPQYIGVMPGRRPFLPSIRSFPGSFKDRIVQAIKVSSSEDAVEQRLAAGLLRELLASSSRNAFIEI